jgi:hypothetical protein
LAICLLISPVMTTRTFDLLISSSILSYGLCGTRASDPQSPNLPLFSHRFPGFHQRQSQLMKADRVRHIYSLNFARVYQRTKSFYQKHEDTGDGLEDWIP